MGGSGVADLHAHSRRSDGALSPSEVVRQARAAGLSRLALTDHDTVLGVAEAMQAGLRDGVDVIPGVELSVQETDPDGGEKTELHLLGYFVDRLAPDLVAYLDRAQADRVAAMDETIARLEELGMSINRERVQALAAGGVVTRPHVAQALVEAGHVASVPDAFDRFLGTGGLAAKPRPVPDVRLALQTVHAAGGVTSLAHPVFCQDPAWPERLARLPGLLDRLVAAGLDAVECFYPDARPGVAEQLATWAHQRGVLVTGGTDYHGPGKAPFAPLGQVAVDDATVEQLRARARTAPGVSPPHLGGRA